MTTTRELRTVLRDVEPGFRGIEVAAIRAQAKRIRTRRRVASAVVGSVAVVSAAVSLPHLPFHPAKRSMQAAMPAASPDEMRTMPTAARTPGPFRPRTGLLPKVTSTGPKVDAGVNDFQVWLKPSANRAGEVCQGRVSRSLSCDSLERLQTGLAAATGLTTDGHDGLVHILVAEAPIERVTASSWGRVVKPTIQDLGQGYVLVVALMPKQPADAPSLDEHIWLYDDKDQLVAGVGLGDAAGPEVDSGVEAEPGAGAPRKYPAVAGAGKPVTVGLGGEQIWMAEPTDERGLPVVCLLEHEGSVESCADINTTSSSVLYTLGITADPGKDVELVITDAKVTRATATMDGTSVPAEIVDLGSGYLALRAVFDVGYGVDRRIELHGFGARNVELVTSAVGVRLTK